MAFRRTYFTDGQVTSPQITPEAVTEEKIADNAVTSAKIKDETITGADIGAGQVQTQDIADGAVTQAKLGPDVSIIPLEDNAVTTPKIADNAVVAEKIANNAVVADKIAAGAVTSTKIPDGSITNVKIATNTITQGKIANNAIGTGEIQNGAVTPEKLSFSVPTRPLTPPVTTDEIGDGQVTQAKLAPGVGGGDRFVWGTEGQSGNPRSSADVLYLTNISADIPYTAFDLSAWVPANAKGVILQLGIFNQSFTQGRAFFRVRTNADQRDALGVGLVPGGFSQVANQGIVPLVVGTEPRTIEYALESVGGPWTATLTLWITVVGYIL